MRDEAETTPLEERSQFHGASHRLKGFDIPLRTHNSRVLVLDLRSTLADLLHNHIDRLDNIERLEASNYHGLVVFAGNEVVGPHTDHHTDMAWANETIQAQIGRVQDSFHRRNNGHMVAEDREIRNTFSLCPQERDGCRGRGGRCYEFLGL